MNYELVAGLEVHVELSTNSKIFCGCSTAFGGAPNTQTCPVCSGNPGSLPVLNKKVVEYGILAGLALQCQITRENKFDRKNYFYPDLPKAYQISQLYCPICTNGKLEIETEAGKKEIRIHEIHMEEDAGKLIHEGDKNTLVDYNRCGVPLLEIVSEPDFRSSEEVLAYLEKLREILVYLGVSDCKMQEGSMRADVNVSVRRVGESAFGTRAEMKNMNSLKAISRAIAYEKERQIRLLDAGKTVVQETRRWDDERGESFSMRTKEDAQDYRYFPDPDLLPVYIGEKMLKEVKSKMPELAEKKRQRYQAKYGLSGYDAKILTTHKEWAALFEATLAISKEPKETANLIMGDMMRLASDSATLPEDIKTAPEKLAALIALIAEGKINRTVGKEVIEEVFYHDVDPVEYVTQKGLLMVSDPALLKRTIIEVIEENPKAVEEFKGGKEKAFASLVGQAMKKLKGKGDPKEINQLLREKLK